MTELYSVHSLVRGFAYEGTRYEEVKVTWFVVERPVPLVPYESAIADYGQLDARARTFPEEAIDEQFSGPAAEELKRYLGRKPGVVTHIEPFELPVMANASGCRRLKRGGGGDVPAGDAEHLRRLLLLANHGPAPYRRPWGSTRRSAAGGSSQKSAPHANMTGMSARSTGSSGYDRRPPT